MQRSNTLPALQKPTLNSYVLAPACHYLSCLFTWKPQGSKSTRQTTSHPYRLSGMFLCFQITVGCLLSELLKVPKTTYKLASKLAPLSLHPITTSV
jgi:hypothetical protein